MNIPMHYGPPSGIPQIYDTADYWADMVIGAENSGIGGTYVSCGVSMLSGLSRTLPKDIVRKVLEQRAATDRKTVREAFVIFSDIDYKSDCCGNALCSYIRENNLGNIVEFGPKTNPNTGNKIKLWVWEPPHVSFRPRDKLMPTYGKIIRKPGTLEAYYEEDLRFADSRGSREA